MVLISREVQNPSAPLPRGFIRTVFSKVIELIG